MKPDRDIATAAVMCDCSGTGFSSQGVIEDAPATGYDHWKRGAVAGAEFALAIAGRPGLHVTVTRISGRDGIDTNPSIVAAAAALAVWQALEFDPPQAALDAVEERALHSWTNGPDEVPIFAVGS